MEVFLKRKNNAVYAKGIYDPDTKTLTVLKGSIVSETVAHTERFRGANTIDKYRDQYCQGRKVKQDVPLKSASTAANFVTGSSTNGLTAWKDANGNSIKQLSEEK